MQVDQRECRDKRTTDTAKYRHGNAIMNLVQRTVTAIPYKGMLVSKERITTER